MITFKGKNLATLLIALSFSVNCCSTTLATSLTGSSSKGSEDEGNSESPVDLSDTQLTFSGRNALPFIDITPADYDCVNHVYSNGLFKGTSNTEFSPDRAFTRGMMVTVLSRLTKLNESGELKDTGFQDVPTNLYCAKAVNWAVQAGVASGVTKDYFEPSTRVTHEQSAVMLYRFAALYEGMDKNITSDLSEYSDGSSVASYAQKAVRWCDSYGLFDGMTTLAPKNTTTRIEATRMLYQLSQIFQSNQPSGYARLLKHSGSTDEWTCNRTIYYDLNGDGLEECISTQSNPENNVLGTYIYGIIDGQTKEIFNEISFLYDGESNEKVRVVVKDIDTSYGESKRSYDQEQ